MVLDIIFLLVLSYGIFVGYSKGIIKTVFAIIAFLIGFLIAGRFAQHVSDFLTKTFELTGSWVFLLSFVLTFLVTMFLIRFLARLLEKALESVNLGVINKLAGGIITGAFFIFILSILVWFVDKSTLLPESQKEESITFPFMQTFPQEVKTFVKKLQPTASKIWDESKETIDEMK